MADLVLKNAARHSEPSSVVNVSLVVKKAKFAIRRLYIWWVDGLEPVGKVGLREIDDAEYHSLRLTL